VEAIIMTSTTQINDSVTHDTTGARRLRLVLAALLAFVGLGGVFGGIQMLADPYEPMGMTPHMISRTPFDTYSVPGVLLLVLLGLTPLVLAVALLLRTTSAAGCAAAFGLGLLAWIATQWALTDARLRLQPVLFSVGLAVVVVAVLLWRREDRTHQGEEP
jgi:uncharacterized membrane protein